MNFNNDFYFGNLPFVYKILHSPDNDLGIPNSLPFSLSINKKTGCIIQKYNDEIFDIIKRVYQKGTVISGNSESEGFGKVYTDIYVSYIKSLFKNPNLKNIKVLDIGCGTGYLAYRLKLLGADVIGLEPGQQSMVGFKKYNIPIVNDIFPSPELKGKFDLITLINVLEHIPDPVSFIKSVVKYLANLGKLVIAVEDEEIYLKRGDISFLFHEHYSYFTEDTLGNTLMASEISDFKITKSDFSHELLSVCQFTGVKKDNEINTDNALKLFNSFINRYQNFKLKLMNLILNAQKRGKILGIYVPGRILNFITNLESPENYLRFFDDNPILEGTYYPGFKIPIETRKQLLGKLPDLVIIMSSSFGEKIKNELIKSINKKIDIITIDEIERMEI